MAECEVGLIVDGKISACMRPIEVPDWVQGKKTWVENTFASLCPSPCRVRSQYQDGAVGEPGDCDEGEVRAWLQFTLDCLPPEEEED